MKNNLSLKKKVNDTIRQFIMMSRASWTCIVFDVVV